jgi:Skp family chaperone for outer membrane proteins
MKAEGLKWFRGITLVAIMTITPVLFMFPGGVLGQTETENFTRLGVIDMREAIQASNAMSTIRAALDEQNVTFQAAISEEEVELLEAERELSTARSTLTEEEFNERVKAFEQRVIAIQRSIQNQKNSFDSSIQQAQSQLEQELLRIVSDIAQERSLSMVIQRQNVVVYTNTLDITDEALDRLNERTKNLTLTKIAPGSATEN